MPYLEKSREKKNIGNIITNALFLVILNLVLMLIFGYLTIDSEANINSRLGALLLSYFLPLFIVHKTIKMSGIERMLKFGTGFIFYILLILVMHGIAIGFRTGLFISLTICLAVLFYGKKFSAKKTR